MVAWLFVALITTQSFTANLSSLITLQQLNESPVTIDTLKKSSAKVGCDADSFVVAYLRNVLYIQDENIVRIRNEEEDAAALINGSIAAAFLEIPYIKAFLAKNCNGFTTSGPIYKVGGFGFVSFHSPSETYTDNLCAQVFILSHLNYVTGFPKEFSIYS